MCKPCYTLWYKSQNPDHWRRVDPVKRKAATRKWEKNHPEKTRVYRKRRRVRKEYNLSLEEYQSLLAQSCAVCGAKEGLHLDHDHKTGKVRGVLCARHNHALGLCQDNASELRALVDYLEVVSDEGEG